jgi:hypothetical protein
LTPHIRQRVIIKTKDHKATPDWGHARVLSELKRPDKKHGKTVEILALLKDNVL